MKLLIVNTETGETYNYKKIKRLKIDYQGSYWLTIKRSFKKKYEMCWNPKIEKLIIK